MAVCCCNLAITKRQRKFLTTRFGVRTARYYHQDFEQAASLFTRQDSDLAVFNEANARAHRRDYVGARTRYDLLLHRNPEFPGARANREFIHQIIEASNRLSESQTEEAGVGSETLDGDNDPQIGEGAETLAGEIEPRTQYSAEEIFASPETAALWMKNVHLIPPTSCAVNLIVSSKSGASANHDCELEPSI